MPEEGVELTPTSDLLSASEIVKLARLFVTQGVTKIRLTGGEPLVRKDIADIVGMKVKLKCLFVLQTAVARYEMLFVVIAGSLASIPCLDSISMTTNGLTLSHKLRQLYDSGLRGLNISLDTLVPQKFEFISRRNGWDKVMRAINEALDIGISPLKVS